MDTVLRTLRRRGVKILRRIGIILILFCSLITVVIVLSAKQDEVLSNPSVVIKETEVEEEKPIALEDKPKDEIINTTEEIEKQIVGDKKLIRYVNVSTLNIRSEPNTQSDIIRRLYFGEEIEVFKYLEDNDWVVTYVDDQMCYIAKKYLTKKIKSTYYDVQPMSTFKSYMGYKCITSVTSPQYILQQDAYDGDYGIRMIDNRYCVAIGSRFDCNIGQYFDIILSNGTEIKCIKADEKADRDTDETNTYTVKSNYCCTEFVVNTSLLIQKVKRCGSLGVIDGWDSEVCGIRVYNKYH